MALGSVNPVPPVKTGDTAELYASLRIEGQPVASDQIEQVIFIVQKPDHTTITDMGITMEDGQGFYRWSDTVESGVYLAQAQFTLVTGEVRSVMTNFSVVNPFADEPTPTYTQLITQAVWLRLEDAFDTMDGGPWLKEQSLYNFDEGKIASFISEALMDINLQMPPTNFTIDMFCAPMTTPGDNPNMPLLIKAVLILTIRHLMRSYVEQATPQGGQVVWLDRTRYTQMWAAVYQVEYADYIQALRLWKRTTLNLGRSALSVYSKAGRLFPNSQQRSRGAFRGYY